MGIATLERIGVKRLCAWWGLAMATAACAFGSTQPPDRAATAIVVVGAAGETEYGATFDGWAKLWEKACQEAGVRPLTIGLGDPGPTNDVQLLKAALANQEHDTARELWLVLLGHGTFDGKEAKFNLRGPDLSSTDLAEWLSSFHRPMAIIDASSASAPFLNKLSAEGRVVVTATRSGYEQNYARFGQYFSAAISDPKADLDKDGQVSVLEAFLMASHEVAEFYKTTGRLATEHALLDDNGDGRGTPPDWFRGVRAIKKAAEGAALDGLHAHQMHLIPSEAERKLSPELRLQRNELEAKLEKLRDAKTQTPADQYYQQLESILLALARLYETTD
jgi:hypothetical protein